MSPEEAARAMRVPEGFRVTLFAGEPDVRQPIGFCFDDRGRLWVAEAYAYPNWAEEGHDRILIFEDTDGDGKFDRRTVFYDRLNYVTGIEFGFGGLWVASAPHLLFIPDRDGDDQPDGPPEIVLDGFGREGIHNLFNGFTWGPDGWLYGGHGASSFSRVGPPGTLDKDRIPFDGGVFRYHPVKKRFERFAEGTVNPWGIDFNENGQAFISNCVLPHLYHVIQGAHYERRRATSLSRYAYDVIDTIADHRHWVGGQWEDSRGGTPEQIAVGGGHAHAGAMIYLGGTFPEQYRGVMFMVNLHGKRINNDLLEPRGSGFVGRHGNDFLVTPEYRFMGITLRYGPDGAVYLIDWNDPDECHTRNPDRTTGRIFKIAYGERAPERVDLAALSDQELIRLQLHPNEWHVRQARRILQERTAAGRQVGSGPLLEILRDHPETARRLRALWALHVIGGVTEELLFELFRDPDEYVRAWAIQFALEENNASTDLLAELERMAAKDSSAVVRLYLAAGCQRLPGELRWGILEQLALRHEDHDDPNIPLMVWYALQPLVKAQPARALRLAEKTDFPNMGAFVARRISDAD
jgi:putative membrane-bound dehydrogenase-like protein